MYKLLREIFLEMLFCKLLKKTMPFWVLIFSLLSGDYNLAFHLRLIRDVSGATDLFKVNHA